MNDKEFQIEFLKLRYNRCCKDIKCLEAEAGIRGGHIKRYGPQPEPVRDKNYKHLLKFIDELKAERDEAAKCLEALGVQMELTRKKEFHPTAAEREKYNEHEMLERMMRGNYNKYGGEDV